MKKLLIALLFLVLIAGAAFGYWYYFVRVVPFNIVVTSPALRETWSIPSTRIIRWETQEPETIPPEEQTVTSLRLSLRKAWSPNTEPDAAVIADVPYQTTQHTWSIPKDLPAGEYQIRLNLFGNGTAAFPRGGTLWGQIYDSQPFTIK